MANTVSPVARGDATALPWADGSLDLIVTSPPYWTLRSYQDHDGALAGQIGDEDTMEQYLDLLFGVVRECWRVLAPHGVACVVIGDTRSGSGGAGGDYGHNGIRAGQPGWTGTGRRGTSGKTGTARRKSLCGLPWRFALGCVDGEADPEGIGWVLVNDLVWHKPAGMPQSVTDRCRDAHEYVFVLAKNPEHYGDGYALAEPYKMSPRRRVTPRVDTAPRLNGKTGNSWSSESTREVPGVDHGNGLGRIPASVWEVNPQVLSQPDYLVVEPDGQIRGVSDPVGLRPLWEGGTDCSPAMRSIAEDALWREVTGKPQAKVIAVRHYATYPPELIGRLVVAFSPEAVCTCCGKPRERVLGRDCEACGAFVRRAAKSCDACGHVRAWKQGRGESEAHGRTDFSTPGRGTPQQAGGFTSSVRSDVMDTEADVRRWHSGASGLGPHGPVGATCQVACACATPDAPTRPGRVGDPFAGSGTTLAVARSLGRDALGTELSDAYCHLASWRVQVGLGGPAVAEAVHEAQQRLFEVAS